MPTTGDVEGGGGGKATIEEKKKGKIMVSLPPKEKKALSPFLSPPAPPRNKAPSSTKTRTAEIPPEIKSPKWKRRRKRRRQKPCSPLACCTTPLMCADISRGDGSCVFPPGPWAFRPKEERGR